MAKLKYAITDDETKSHGSEVTVAFHPVEWQRLADTLSANGISIIPPRPTEIQALRYALQKVLKTTGVLVRPASSRGCYTLQLERRAGAERNDYEQIMACKVIDGAPHWEPQNWLQQRWTRALERSLNDAFVERLTTTQPEDLGTWWRVQVLPVLMATRMEDGQVFVPKTKHLIVDQIKRIIVDLGAGKVWRKPMIKCDDVVELVLDAITNEGLRAASEMQAWLDDKTQVTDKGRRAKLEDLAEIKRRVAFYSDLFKVPLDAVNAQLEATKNKLATVFWQASSETMSKDQEQDAAQKRFSLLESDDRKVLPPVEDESTVTRPIELD